MANQKTPDLTFLKRIVFPEVKDRSDTKYVPPYQKNVLIGNWFENKYAKELLQMYVPITSVYNYSYMHPLLKITEKPEAVLQQQRESDKSFNFSKLIFHKNLKREGTMAKEFLYGNRREFDNNFASTNSIVYSNLFHRKVPELFFKSGKADIAKNYGNCSNYGLKELVFKKMKNDAKRTSLYPLAISTVTDSYRSPVGAVYAARYAVPRLLSTSLNKIYIDNKDFKTRDLPVKLVPEYPDYLRRAFLHRKPEKIIPKS